MSLKVWLGHDGYRDPDDNLSLLLGAAYAEAADRARGTVEVEGVIFGDTKDGGQYHMLHPGGDTPDRFGDDSRYGDVEGNRWAVANHAFFEDYGVAALRDLDPSWKVIDLLDSDDGGWRAWNFDATSASALSNGARALATSIAEAVGDGDVVVYSAGGGANVAAEAIGYLRNMGFSQGALLQHFAVVQHGNNWSTNYEAETREITRPFTIAISNQNYAEYANGADGPDLKHALSAGEAPDASALGDDFNRALQVAIGERAFRDLPGDAVFRATRDASDAGSHAFAVDPARVLAAMGDRLSGTEELRPGFDWAHRIDGNDGTGSRSREIYAGFDAGDVDRLLAGRLFPGNGEGGDSGRLVATLASGADDRETVGGGDSADLDLGMSRAEGGEANVVRLDFAHLGLDPDAEIASAYLLFQAKWASDAGGGLTISLADGGGAGIDWTGLGAWTPGETYRSPDLSALVERALAAGETELDFRITGTGHHVAHSQESDGPAPQLIVNWELA